MISADVTLLPTSSIVVDWSERRDTDHDHINALAEGIARDDLIHTLTIEEGTNKLLAGGHRLKAWLQNQANHIPCKNPAYLEWTHIPVRFASDYSESDLARIELIENLQHRKLSWKEESQGLYKIHALQQDLNQAWSVQNTADLIGMSRTSMEKFLIVAPKLDEETSPLQDCESVNAAYNIIAREKQREHADLIEKVVSKGGVATLDPGAILGGKAKPEVKPEPTPLEPTVEPSIVSPILNESFFDFATSYAGPRFNTLMLDFPYGIDQQKGKRQNSVKDLNNYDDSADLYWKLLNCLADNQHILLATSCNIIFWFSQSHRRATEDFFQKRMPNFVVQDFLMIWHRGNSGILPDPKRYGRRNYETAFFLTSGDRLLAKPKALCFEFNAPSSQRDHRSEKPIQVCSHFLSMIIDEHSVFADFTCGSGTSLRAAYDLGASPEYMVGLEIDEAVCGTAQKRFEANAKSDHAVDDFLNKMVALSEAE